MKEQPPTPEQLASQAFEDTHDHLVESGECPITAYKHAQIAYNKTLDKHNK